MALYNQLAFALLVFEIVVFIVLIIPLPFTWRRALFKAVAQSKLVAKALFALKISFIFVTLLFVDAVNHMLKIQREGQLSKETGARTDLRAETDYRSRKFLSERNFYLHGFTLFLSLILSRTYSLVLDLIKAQEDLAILKSKGAGVGSSSDSEKLKQLQKEYDALAATSQKPSDKRVD
ncbi:Endoplasmic reticulum transmembrane protein 3 [Microbotryomycetes sp. JL201]|nr:Endoplasmic reticulum transmembrane protein 3 [Microbotryomycetes sp. JL201]